MTNTKRIKRSEHPRRRTNTPFPMHLERRISLMLVVILLCVCAWAVPQVAQTIAGKSPASSAVGLEGTNVKCAIDRSTGLPTQIATTIGRASVEWLSGPIQLRVRNETTNGPSSLFTGHHVQPEPGGISVAADAAALALNLAERWHATSSGLTWDLTFSGVGKRAGHEVILDLPILSPASQVFTPSERGIINVGRSADYQAVPYGHAGVYTNRAYVLPLVSVFDVKADSALTIALPAGDNIPDLRVSWKDAKTLRLQLGHRAMGGGIPSTLRLLFYAHPADYRCVLKAYIDDFPTYFKPALPRGPYEASFYYHGIQEHPDFDEMARQNVRYLWSSFWFTHVGEYLPPEKEWLPYSHSNWWRLGQTMSDEKINAFVKEMNDHNIAVFAFFNVDEYGGAGIYNGVELHGDSPLMEQDRNEKFGNAVAKDAEGKEIGAWQGDRVMNPDARYAFYPHLMEQVRRHLTRLPGIYGFLIDRMDWASTLDYGHDDGFTMVGDKPAENMAMPIAAAVHEVCRMSHAQGKRVFINQFYRIEMLRDVDGVGHENDYLPALGYLTPLRPAAAWNYRKPYHGDLLQFESQLKRRLQFALFPHMIAHQFQISQQEPDARAADLLEIYAPLFATLIGKEQVLLPHPVTVTGANDANLFRNPEGNYVVPVTARTRFLSRRVAASEIVTVKLRVPDAADFSWAHVYSADGPPYRGTVSLSGGEARIRMDHHQTASIIVAGKGVEPVLNVGDAARLGDLREKLFGPPAQIETAKLERRAAFGGNGVSLIIEGTQVGQWGSVGVQVDGKPVGEVSSAFGTFALSNPLGARPPVVTLTLPDEGMWFVPQRIELVARAADGKTYRIAEWSPNDVAEAGDFPGDLRLQLRWSEPKGSNTK